MNELPIDTAAAAQAAIAPKPARSRSDQLFLDAVAARLQERMDRAVFEHRLRYRRVAP